MATVASMIYSIEAQTSSIEKSMVDVKALVDSVDKSMTTAAASTGGWSSILDTLGGSFVARVAEGQLLRDAIREILSGVKDVIEAFPDLLAHTIAVGNSLFEMSVKTGSSVEGLSTLRYVASQTGINFESFGTTLSMMEKNLGATGAAGKKVSETLTSMGLDLATVKGMRSDEAFLTIAQALFNVGNNADKAHDSALLLGRGAKEMAVLWHEDIGPMIQEAKDLGLVMSTETAAGAHLAEIGFQSLEMQLEGLGMHIANAFLPAIIGIEGDLGVGLHDAVTTLNGSLGALGGEGGFLSTVARAMGTGDQATKAQIELYEMLKATLIGLVRNTLEPLISTIGFVMTEWNAANVVMGDVTQVLDMLEVSLAVVAAGSYKLVQALIAVSTGGLKTDAFQADIDKLNTGILSTLDTMQKRADALQADKKAEADWSTWAVNANKAVEVALNAIAAAHTDVGKKITEMADVSRAAYGQTGDAADAAAAETKKYEAALADLQSVGEDWRGTLAAMDPFIVTMAEHMLAAGAPMSALVEVFHLTAAEAKALTSEVKELTAAEKLHAGAVLSTAKLEADYAAELTKLTGTVYEAKIAAIDKWETDQREAFARLHHTADDQAAWEIALANDVAIKKRAISENQVTLANGDSERYRRTLQERAQNELDTYNRMAAASSGYSQKEIADQAQVVIATRLAAESWWQTFDAAGNKVVAKVAAVSQTTIGWLDQVIAKEDAAAKAAIDQMHQGSVLAGGPISADVMNLLRFQGLTDNRMSPGAGISGTQFTGTSAQLLAAEAAFPSRDTGGPGVAGQSYRIGTGAQPEVFTPSTSGTFTPNGGSGGTQVINLVVDGKVLASIVNDHNTRTMKATRKFQGA